MLMFKKNFGFCARSVKHHPLLLIGRRLTTSRLAETFPMLFETEESDDAADSGWSDDENEGPRELRCTPLEQPSQ